MSLKMNNSGIISKITSADGINYLNIGLMLISLIAAYILPFEVFLFSYAVLGPLHYLTEISWLEKKKYFIKSKNDIWLFVFFVVLVTVGILNNKSKLSLLMGSFLFSGFVYALILLYVEKLGTRLLLLFLVFFLSMLFGFNKAPNLHFIIFAVWLPTIIHVFIFTGAFILYGALKSKSTSGILSLLVFLLCALTVFIYIPDNFGISVSDYAKKAYSHFTALNITLYNFFGFGNLKINDDALYLSTKALAVMRFISFAYVYHYLNWFSKTTVIKWNQISKHRLTVIIVLWVLSVVLYIFSYKAGVYALLLLSLFHVFFEFPLNHQTFIGIGKELKDIIIRR